MRVLLFAFVITLFVPGGIGIQLGSLTITPALLVLILLFPTLLAMGSIRWVWPDAVIVLFFAATFYSTLRSVPASQAIEAFGRGFLLSAVPYMTGRYIAANPQSFTRFIRLSIFLMAVLAVFVMMETFFRFNIHSFIWNLPYTPHPEKRMGLTRAYGWTSHSIMLGIAYAAFVPLAVVFALDKVRGMGRQMWVKLAFLLIAVFCSLSTGAWLPVAISVALVGWDYMRLLPPGSRWLLVSVGGSSAYFILEVVSGRPLLRILMMELHLSSPLAWYYRWELFRRVYEVMPGYEWFGHGIKTPEAINANGQWSIDNNYLVMLMSFGRVGLTLWIGLAVAMLVYGWKSVWNAPDKTSVRIARAIMIAVVAICLTQLSVALFSTAALVYWLFLGLGIGMAQKLATAQPAKKRVAQPRRPAPSARDQPVPYAQPHVETRDHPGRELAGGQR